MREFLVWQVGQPIPFCDCICTSSTFDCVCSVDWLGKLALIEFSCANKGFASSEVSFWVPGWGVVCGCSIKSSIDKGFSCAC